jgi:hypothetical protein
MMANEIDIDDIPEDDAPTAPVAVAEPPAPEPEPVPEKEEELDVLNVLEPNVEPREVTLRHAGHERVYVQKPLAYFRKMEFFGLLGKTIDEAMEGDDGLRVNSLFGAVPTSVTEVTDLDGFLALVAKIASHAPDFLKEAYLLWLDVPKTERPWARDALDYVTDQEGEDILNTFIDQNWESLESFFGERAQRVLKRIQARRKS